MGKMGNTLVWLLLYVGTRLVYQAQADYLVGIRIQDYETDCSTCGTYFRYCVQSNGGREECLQSHQHVQPGVALDFSREFLLLRNNPILVRGTTKEWQGAQICLAAFNRNLTGEDELVVEAHMNLTTDNTHIGVETAPVTHTGSFSGSNLTARFVITCAHNWYGPDCNYWCQGDDCTCDLPVPCHDNCVGVVCGENRHCVDGVDVYVCTCDAGFVGGQCEVNVDECEGVNCSGNGRCIDGVDSFSCECDAGYYGPLCNYNDTGSNSTILDNRIAEQKAFTFLISAIIGWVLFATLGLVVLLVLIIVKLSNGRRRYDTRSSLNGAGVPNPFYQASTEPNVSYHATAPPEIGTNINYTVQVPGVATTNVNITHSEGPRNKSGMVYNQTYEKSEGLYEYMP